MKANYLLRNRSRFNYFHKIGLLLVVLVVGGLFFSIFNHQIVSLVAPLWKVENVFTRSISNSWKYLDGRRDYIQENNALRDEIASLNSRVFELSRFEVERESLLDLVGRKPEGGAVAAGVLSHPPQTPYDILIVDAGREEGVEVGLEVVLPEGATIGRVSEVMSRLARVKLFSATGEETNAVLERGSIPIVLTGEGGGSFVVKLPRDTEVQVGDAILSSDINSRLIAVVEEVQIESTDSFKEVLARSPANIFSLRFVFITSP